ncbi:LamG domain-containing protein [Streptomyces sp. NPDC006798]|uniref:LamG domain-containing protein n=1 Tax=Streptomyces sp. NPDC006798 TaxID=3155462 RepID=UPI0033CD78EB
MTTAADQNLLKTYSDRAYTHTTMVRHQGTALAFAMDDKRRIVYTVLDLSAHDPKRGELDAAYWSDNPAELPFPDEILKVGYAVAGAVRLPAVKRGGRIEARRDETLTAEQTDLFLSSTARLTAAAPFQVLSDGTHVVVLRQAISAGHTDAVHILSGGGVSGDPSRTDFLQSSGAKVALVADTLLCDRFLLVSGKLKPVAEVRYRRSRHKTEPKTAKDSLGAADMDGKLFHEPTHELAFLRNLTEGRFAAVLTPTAVQTQRRWQFFAYNNLTRRIDSFNVEQAPDGLFNTQGTRYWTSPEPRYRASVYERAPGLCPFTDRALVPVSPEGHLAESAIQLNLNGGSAYVDLGTATTLRFQGGGYTVEAWVKPQPAGGPVLARWNGAGQGGFQLRVSGSGQVILEHSGASSLTATQTIASGTWSHLAVSYNGTTATLYVNGEFAGSATIAYAADGGAALRIGSTQNGTYFSGAVDEVRIWNRGRSQAELTEDRSYRLIGNEPGLIAYYRLDEGSGTLAYDQTDSAVNGTVTGAAASWVTSDAPIADHPGVRRDSFTLSGRDVVSGLSATLYYQQEDTTSGYDEAAKPAKRQARVLLACATRPSGNTAAEAHIATVDLGVGVDGRLAAVPDVITLAELGRPVEETSDRVSAQESRVRQLEQELATMESEAHLLVVEKESLQAGAAADTDPAKWAVRLHYTSSLNRLYFFSHYKSGTVESTRVASADDTSATREWRLMPVPGSAGRYGNPAYVLVSLASGNPVVVSPNGTREAPLTVSRISLTSPVPASAQWYMRGGLDSRVQFQNVETGMWIWYGYAQGQETDAYTFSIERVAGSSDPARRLRISELGNRLLQADRDMMAKSNEITQAREELARLSGGLLGAGDLVMPVPHLATDVNGLGAAGALLKFARTAATPALVDSASGRVTLYFQGANNQFFAAYLDTSTVRGVQQLTGGGLTALFTARDPGVDLSTTQTQITVAAAVVNGVTMDGLCNLTITRGTETERFTQLPRRAGVLAAVLNGTGDEPVQVGTVASVSNDEVRLTKETAVAVARGSYVRIGEKNHLVTVDAAAKATVLRVYPAPPPGLAAGTTVSVVRYDHAGATASRPGASLARGSRWVTVSADKADLPVPNGTATARLSGYGSRWRGDAPGRAFRFEGLHHRLTLPTGRLDQVTVPAGDLTVEAWTKPQRIPATRSRVLHVKRGETKAALTLVPGPAVTGGMVLDGTNDAMLIEGADPTGTDFTIECWLKRTTGRTVADTIVAIGANGLTMGFTADAKFSFGFGTGTTAQILTTTGAYTDGEWHHWAVTFNRATRVQTIVRDGAEVARRTATALPGGTGGLIVGRSDSGTVRSYSGRLAELRTWSVARTATEIDADRAQRISRAPGLTGAWTYETAATTDGDRKFTDLGPQQRHGGVWGSPATSESALTTHRIQVAVGDKARQSRDTYPNGEWAHLAVAYEQSWALGFDGTAWAETPDAETLDLTEDLTIEVFARIDAIGARQGLVSKGRLGSGDGGSAPYQFVLRPDGKLEFAFEEPGPVVRRFTSTSAVTAGFHRFAVVRKGGSTTEETKGTRDITYTDADGTQRTQRVDVVDKVEAKKWDDIRFVVDGTEIGTSRYTGPGPRGNDGALQIGRAVDGTAVHSLKGTVGEVRIWSKARDTNRLGTALQPRDEGLVGRWTFEENTGSTSEDVAGGHDVKLRGARWAPDPDPLASSFLVLRNGQSVPLEIPAANPLTDWGDDQLTLGAVIRSGTGSEYYDGVLEEVRLWRTARTREQLLDSLFTRLKGDKQDLVAYWPFDSESTTATAEAVRDHSLRGNDLGLDASSPNIVLSTAPVSTDTAAVRSALAGVSTPFHQSVSAPPSAAEYADLQYTATGEASGVLKRAYAHISNGTWQLTTGYKVGDLISEWVGQVQFDPQLIGYIEGAPPVPSENLTGDSDPTGASSVTFKQAEEVTSTLSSARERSVDAAFSMSAGLEVDAQVLLLTAPLGFGTAQPLVDVTVKGRIGGSFEYSNAWTDETSVSQGTSTSRDTTASLTVTREPENKILNTDIGRRYVPANNGYALVQSETADVYALRLAHSGALVAYRIMPNPDIPKDWNIISFPVNPQYTKQGTLDGAVGFNAQGKVLDPSYPNASQRGEHSYFKPREAYAIKRRILRERQELETYYANVSTETHTPDPTEGRAARVLESFVGTTPGAPGKNPPTESAGSFANRNIVNTYVWTADGGFFAETTGTTDVVTQTTGGSYSVSGSLNTSLEIGFEVAGVGVGLQFDASLGGGMTVTRQRAGEATRSHSLEVVCNPTRDIQKRDANNKLMYDTAGRPDRVPGKVDAYRFMTFYLGQDTSHFDDFYHKVVDPTWLATSNEPHATALRQARHSDRKPPCWRVLHRVTYISRVLPPVPPADAPPLEKALRAVDVPSNYELIRRLDPYVSTAIASASELAAATRTALATHLPQLLPHEVEITKFLVNYYGVTE